MNFEDIEFKEFNVYNSNFDVNSGEIYTDKRRKCDYTVMLSKETGTMDDAYEQDPNIRKYYNKETRYEYAYLHFDNKFDIRIKRQEGKYSCCIFFSFPKSEKPYSLNVMEPIDVYNDISKDELMSIINRVERMSQHPLEWINIWL